MITIDLDNKNSYKKIVITQSQTDPAIFFIFFNKKDPKEVQELLKSVKNGNYGNVSFDKYSFSQEECPLKEVLVTNLKTLVTLPYIKGEEGILYVNSGTCKVPKEGVEVLTEIKRNDNTTVFMVVKVKKGAKNINNFTTTVIFLLILIIFNFSQI